MENITTTAATTTFINATTVPTLQNITPAVVVFVILLCVLGLVALYWVLASSRMAGLVVSALVNRLLLSEGETLIIGAVNFSFTQGRIALGSLTYTTRNTSTSAVSGFVTVRYWRRSVQTEFANAGKLPPRISIDLSGVQVQIFNNSDKFAEMQRTKDMRADEVVKAAMETQRKKAAEANAANPASTAIPWYYLAAPAIGVAITQGSIVIAAMDQQFHTAITFRGARGMLCVTKTEFPADHYTYIMKMTMRMAEVTLIPNKHRIPRSMSMNGEGLVGGSIQEAVSMNALQNSEGEHEGVAGWTESNKFIYNNCWNSKAGEYVCGCAEHHVMHSPLMKILYSQAQGGIISQPYDREYSPDFSMRVHGKDCVVNYGAWANFQRALQQQRFLPDDFKSFEERVYNPEKGMLRVAGFFKVYIHLSLRKNVPPALARTHTKFRIPYRRDLYPSEVRDKERLLPYAVEWLEAQIQGDLIIDYKLPWVILPGDPGYAHEFTVTASDVTFISSFNRAPLLFARNMAITGNLFNNVDWRLPALWTFDISLSDSNIWLLYDHVNMMTDLARSWTSFSTDPEEKRGLTHFQPILYTVKFRLENGFRMMLNANQYNIVDTHNSTEENTYFMLQSAELNATITIPFVEYCLPFTKVGFDVRTPTPLHVRLSVPKWHSLRFMSREPLDSTNFISLDELRLSGSYLYYSEKSPEVLDVMDMTVELHNPSCMLYSYYLKYFLSLKNNYLGVFQSHMSSYTFRDWQEGVSSVGHPKTVGNVMDASVRVITVGPVAISVPVDMYSSERTVLVSTQQLLIEVRSHAHFMQLHLDAAPISLVIPMARAEHDSAVAKTLRLNSLPNLEVDGFSLGFYLSYGPEPERETYRERFAINVGQARGQIAAGQALTAVTMLVNFFHHMYSWDDELWNDINRFNTTIRQNKLRVLMEVDVNITGLELYVSVMDSVLHLSSTEGAKIHYDTRHTPLYTDVITVTVPPVNILQYLSMTMDEMSEQGEWADVANIHVGLDIRVVSKRDTWLAEMRDQNEFMAHNDAVTRRNLVYFQHVAKTLEDAISERRAQRTDSNDDDLRASAFGGPATSSGAPKDSSTQDDFSAQTKRCGRRYRMSAEGDDDHAYGSDPLSFVMVAKQEDPSPFGRKAAAHVRTAAATLKPSLDPRLSNANAASVDVAGSASGGGGGVSGAAGGTASSGNNNNNNDANDASKEIPLAGFDEYTAVIEKIAALTDRLAKMVNSTAKNPYNHNLHDKEVTSVFFRPCENVVIAISPNTLSSVHRWIDAMTEEAPFVNSYWDSMKLSFTKANFFSPKHLFETLQISLVVPPLRLEFYSLEGEHVMAGLLINNLSLSLSLAEQMAITGEQGVEHGRRRALTQLVKIPQDSAIEMLALGGGNNSTMVLNSVSLIDKEADDFSESAGPASPREKTASKKGSMTEEEKAASDNLRKSRRISRALPFKKQLTGGGFKGDSDSSNKFNSRASVKIEEEKLQFEGKSLLRKLSLKLSLDSLSVVVFESAEPAPTPAPVMLLVLSKLSSTVLLKRPTDSGKGAAKVSIARIDLTSHSLLMQNIPELLCHWYFSVFDLGDSMGRLIQKRQSQRQQLIAATLVHASEGGMPPEGKSLIQPVLDPKAQLSRKAWMSAYYLQSLFRQYAPPAPDVAQELVRVPPLLSAQKYWNALVKRFIDDGSNAVDATAGPPAIERQDPISRILRDKDVAAMFGVLPAAVADKRALEMDVLAAIGPLTIAASAGYVDLDRKTVAKLAGVRGRGKMIIGGPEKGSRAAVKLYLELLVQRLTCGVVNNVLQYAAVLQRSLGSWKQTFVTESSKRCSPLGGCVAEAADGGATMGSAARSTKGARDRVEGEEGLLLEIVGGTIKIEPIRLQAIADNGCVMLQVGETTLVYSHTQAFGVKGGGGGGNGAAGVSASGGSRGGGRGGRSNRNNYSSTNANVSDTGAGGLDDQLQHSAVIVLGEVRLALYGTSSPDKKDEAKGRIAEVKVSGFKFSELMFVQRNPVTQRKTDAYAIVGNVDQIDVPFQIGNAGRLGLFLQEWKLETARSEMSANTMFEERASSAQPSVAAADDGLFGTAPRPSVTVNLLIRNVCVRTGDLAALDFKYEIPGIGLEIDAQKSLVFARFSVPLHYVAFGAMNGKGKGEKTETSGGNSAEPRQGAEDVDLSEFFEGRKIVLPNLLLTMQYDAILSNKVTYRRQQQQLQPQVQSPGSPQQQQQQQQQQEVDSDASENADDGPELLKRHEHLTVRLLVGPLKAHVSTQLVSQALSCVSKLEKQIQEASEMWVESEERKREEPVPSLEQKLNKTAVSVRMWYQISVVFSGINIRAESPSATLLVRMADLVLEIGNESVGHQHNPGDGALHSRRNFRDFYLTLGMPELSMWLLSTSVKYREQARDILFENPAETDGIFFAFMTHMSVSNFYAFDKIGAAEPKERMSGRREGEAEWSSDEASASVDGERDINDTVSLADVLQNVVIEIHNTVVILQPQTPVHISRMFMHYLNSANEFRRGLNSIIRENPVVHESTLRFKEAAKSAKKRAAAAVEEDGLSRENAGDFLWTFLQNFAVTVRIVNVGLVVPFRNYRYYSARSVSDKDSGGAGNGATGGAGNVASLLEQYCHVAATIDALILRGFAGPLIREEQGSKIVALADLNNVRVGFGEQTDIHKMVRVFQTFDLDPNQTCSKVVPLICQAFMAGCKLTTYLQLVRTGLEDVKVELQTTGVELELNPSLYAMYKLLEAEARVAMERSKTTAARARFLMNEIRAGVGKDVSSASTPVMMRSSMADISEALKQPRPRRSSLSNSTQQLLSLTPPRQPSRSDHKRAVSADRGRSPSPLSPRLQIFGRSVTLSLVVKIGAGRCALFLVKDGISFGHAKKLYDFDFPMVVLRVRHAMTFPETPMQQTSPTHVRGGSDKGSSTPTLPLDLSSSETHVMLMVEPLMVRLPPSILEFLVQGTAQLKTFAKMSQMFESELGAKWSSPHSSPQPQRPPSPRKATPTGKSPDLTEEEEAALPDLLNASAKLGQVTIAVSFKGIRLELDCNPVTEVLCAFALGRLDLCASSAEMEEPEDLLIDSVNALNVTFHLHKAEIKVFNRWIKTDTVGVDLGGITGNVGRRQKIFLDRHKESVVSGFFGVKEAQLTFSMTSLKSWFVVQDLWITRLKAIPFPKSELVEQSVSPTMAPSVVAQLPQLSPQSSKKGVALRRGHRKSSSTAGTDFASLKLSGIPPSSLRPGAKGLHSRKSTAMLEEVIGRTASLTLKPRSESSEPEESEPVPDEPAVVPKLKNRVSISMGAVLASVGAEADLGLVGNLTVKVGGLALRGLVPHQIVKPNVRTSILFVETALQQVDLNFAGKLRGSLRLNSLSVVGDRSENALLHNDLEIIVAPIMSDLSYKSSQILFLDTGNIALHVCDSPDGAVNVKLTSEKLHAQLSSETIASASSIVRRLMENVGKCQQDANLLISQANIRLTYDSAQAEGSMATGRRAQQLLRKDKLKRKSSSQSFIRKVVERVTAETKVNLKLEVSGQDLSVALFADVIKDAQWIQLNVSSYELELAISTDKVADGPPEMVRELITKVGTAVISRMIESERNVAKNWVRSSSSDPILEFPASSLVMRTRQAVSGPRRREMDCWFVTQFGDTIRVTLRVELFAFLRELAMTLKGKLSTVLESGGAAAGGASASSTPVSGKQGGDAKVAAKSPPPPALALASSRGPVIQIKAFVLEPRVNVLENLTPYALTKVFELLKIGDPQNMIPEAVHAAVTVNAEKLLFAVKQMFLRIDEAYAPKKKQIEAPAPKTSGVPRLNLATPSMSRTPGVAKKDDSPRSAANNRNKSSLGSVLRTTPAMPRLTPSLSRIDSKVEQDAGDSVFSLLDDDF